MTKKQWKIEDWAGNEMFDGKLFKTFEDADEFLGIFILKTYPDTENNDDRFSEERGEYEIVRNQNDD